MAFVSKTGQAVTKEQLVEYITRRCEDLTAQLTKWQGEFMKDPAYSFAWADTMFERAAEHECFSWTILMLEKNDVQAVLDALRTDLMRKAQRRSSSTSQASNLMDDCRRVAQTKAIEMVAWAVVSK